MTTAARTIAGLILVLVLMVDIAMTIAAKEPSFAGGGLSLLSKSDWPTDSSRLHSSSSPARPVPRPTTSSPTDAPPPAVGADRRVALQPTASPHPLPAAVGSVSPDWKVRARRTSQPSQPRILVDDPLPAAQGLQAIPASRGAIAVETPGPVSIAQAPATVEQPASAVTIRLDATGGLDLPALAHLEVVLRGDDALAANARLSTVGEALDQSLAEHWKKAFDFIEPRMVSTSFDAGTKEEHLVMDGVATLAWKEADDGRGRRYQADGFGLMSGSDAVPAPAFEQVTETIVLPNLGRGFTVEGPEVDLQSGARAFRRTAAIADGLFTMTASLRSAAPSPAASPPADPGTAFGGSLYVRAPANYEKTPQEVDALRASSLASAGDYVGRGSLLLRRAMWPEARADFAKATLLDPTSSRAYAGLAVAEAWSGDEALAAVDLDKATALNPNEPFVFDGRAILAQRKGNAADAFAAYGHALELDPGDGFAREQRSALDATLKGADASLTVPPQRLSTNPDR
jgi:hypothetical protein